MPAPAFVQQNNGALGSAGTTGTATFSGNNHQGNFLFLAVFAGVSSTVTVTSPDSAGNVWTKIGSNLGPPGAGRSIAIFYAPNCKGGVNPIVTFTSNNTDFIDWEILEYSGVATANPLDVNGNAVGNSAVFDSGGVSTMQQNELVLGIVDVQNPGAAFAAGYTVRCDRGGESFMVADQVLANPGVVHASGTNPSGPWGAWVVTFLAAMPALLQSQFGDGSDGPFTFDNAAANQPFATRSGSVWTLLRDVFLDDNSFVNAGVTISTAGFRVFCRGRLTLQSGSPGGIIDNSGTNAAGQVAGLSSSAGTLQNGSTGATGAAAGVAGSQSPARTFSYGGVPGSGGSGNGGANAGGSNAGRFNPPGAAAGTIHYGSQFIDGTVTGFGNPGPIYVTGGPGGCAGGGGSTGTGGGGGGGGGVMVVAARFLSILAGGAIQANGGNGGAGGAANGGGGGGGAGGCVLVSYEQVTPSPTIQAVGGTGGAGNGTGAAGGAGGNGQVFQFTVTD